MTSGTARWIAKWKATPRSLPSLKCSVCFGQFDHSYAVAAQSRASEIAALDPLRLDLVELNNGGERSKQLVLTEIGEARGRRHRSRGLCPYTARGRDTYETS